MKKLLLGLTASICMFSHPTFAQDTARPAKVFTVAEQSSQVVRRYPGLVLPSQEIELSFRISGNLIELPVLASQQVRKGDVIAQLDTRDLRSQAAQMQSSIDQAVAQLTVLKAGARAQEIAALEAAIDASQAQLSQAEDNAARSRQLAEKGTVSAAKLDQDEASLRVAQADLRAKKEDLSLAKEGARSEEITSAEASIRGLQAQLGSIQDSISDATLRAPFNGIIARRDVDNFTNIQAGQAVVLLQALSVIHVAFDVPAPDVTQLTANGPDNITNTVILDAIPGEEFASETVEFSVQAQSGTQTYRGRVAVKVPETALILPGMVGTVIASAPGAKARLSVPLTAVAAAADGNPKVWVVGADNSVSERSITLGELMGGLVEVTKGLQSGETVVSAGISALVPGMKIRPVNKIGG